MKLKRLINNCELIIYGHASVWSFQSMIQVANYESPLDQRYLQSLPTIFVKLNLPNTQSRVPLVLIITVLTVVEGG